MNIRKILYQLNSEQQQILQEENNSISKKCREVASIERKEQKENEKSRNGRCPKCRAKQDKIVDKMALVEGISNFRGNIFKIVGRLAVETKPVNHCMVCGNEWEKFKTKVITDGAVMKVILNYLSDVMHAPERSERYSWKLEAIDIFNGCYAETIYSIQNANKGGVRHPVSLRKLRTKYKSIFDK